jgi:mono/diheme cytochrome c family protein
LETLVVERRPRPPARPASCARGPWLVLVAALALGGCDLLPQRSAGEKLWRARCAECHGLDGAGNTPRFMGNVAADLLDDSWQHGDGPGAWGVVIREGIVGSMPRNDDLTREQVRALTDYMQELRAGGAGR